ncbi:hypothetical protein Sste5346_002730 [Sporothrix stenoceras]|uniref:rRNA methyltransferase 1, mitochondrial n=1 Tax=Sporothrix stenoceras TaxID=5173 RepID=A0ABR3ZI92_9PEZI
MRSFTSSTITARLSPLVSNHAQRTLVNQHQQLALNRHAVFSRPSSMSAIVRGLRREFRDPKGRRPPGYNPIVAEHVTKRRLEREAADVPKYKLFRGKKDVTERPVPKAKTRRARFFDPEDEYGKKSIVYQAKTGKLEAEVKALARQRRQDNGEEGAEGEERLFRRDGGGRNGRNDRNSRDNDLEPRSREGRTGGSWFSSFGGRDGPRSRPDRDRGYDRGGLQDGDRGERQSYNRDRAPDGRSGARDTRDTRSEGRFGREQRRDYDNERSYDGDDRRGDRRGDGRGGGKSPYSAPAPQAIPYTTAASQFLYGRSVVMAALRSAHRQLYKLYIYGGENSSIRGPLKEKYNAQAQEIMSYAKNRGVEMLVVDEKWQRLLDKMSQGRPHNGYILEASPLPQPPLTALGQYTVGTTPIPGEDAPHSEMGAGFPADVGHQSREEAEVNGTKAFVPVDAVTARHHRPLVLLLDQVLDPGNLGGILRSASFLGVSAVVISKHSSATLTTVALKASAGAAEALPLFSVETPAEFLAESQQSGWKVYAAVPPPEGHVPGAPKKKNKKPVYDLESLEAADPLQNDPIILVMGSEGEGLPRAIRRLADADVSISNRSGSDVVDSLNVSVATGLLCASFLKGSTRAIVSAPAVETTAVDIASSEDAVFEKTFEETKTEETKVHGELGLF